MLTFLLRLLEPLWAMRDGRRGVLLLNRLEYPPALVSLRACSCPLLEATSLARGIRDLTTAFVRSGLKSPVAERLLPASCSHRNI